MSDFKIFVEGKADLKFIKDLIQHSFGIDCKDIISFDGKDKWNELNPIIQQHFAQGKKLIFIFDANGNRYERETEIRAKAVELNFIINDLFLLPNNVDNGNLESVLINLVNTAYQSFFNCFDQYTTCLGQNEVYNIPDAKIRLFAYNYSILDNVKTETANETGRNYFNQDYWNLNDPSIEPLKNFLHPLFV